MGYTYDTNKVFCDFVECSAIEISNTVDPLHRKERERRYIEIIKGYDKLKERQKFCEMFTDLAMVLEEIIKSGAAPEARPGKSEAETGNQRSKVTVESVRDKKECRQCGVSVQGKPAVRISARFYLCMECFKGE